MLTDLDDAVSVAVGVPYGFDATVGRLYLLLDTGHLPLSLVNKAHIYSLRDKQVGDVPEPRLWSFRTIHVEAVDGGMMHLGKQPHFVVELEVLAQTRIYLPPECATFGVVVNPLWMQNTAYPLLIHIGPGHRQKALV